MHTLFFKKKNGLEYSMRITFYIILVYISLFSPGLFYGSDFEFLLIKKNRYWFGKFFSY